MEIKKPTKGLQLKTNVKAGCGEDAPPPPTDNSGGTLRGRRFYRR